MEKRFYYVYQFDELTAESKTRAIEKMRHINVTDNLWDELIIEDAENEIESIGFSDVTIYYSGFGSQGDGFSFNAKINLDYWLNKPEYKKLKKLFDADEIEINASIQKNDYANRYSHEKTRYAYIYSCNTNLSELNEDIKLLTEKLEKEVEYSRLGICCKWYRILEDEYYNLISNEFVIETIKCNDYNFRENGDID